MVLFKRLAAGLRALFQKTRVEQELDDELREFLETAAERKMATGMSRDVAIRAARLEMGSLEGVKDRVRDVGWESVVESVWQDVHFAFRMLRKQPGFTAATVATLAIGVGGTTAIFSVVDGLFLRAPAGVSDASSLRKVFIKRDAGNLRTPQGGRGSWVDYVTMRDGSQAFAGIAAFLDPELVDLGRGADVQQIRAGIVSREFLPLLGVRTALGRPFLAEEDGVPGAHPVALISYAMWQRRFGGAADAIGKTLLVNGEPIEIIGVTQKGFTGIDAEVVDLWLPSSIAERVRIEQSYVGGDWRANTGIFARYVARIARGVEDAVAMQRASAALAHAAEGNTELDPTPEVLTTALTLAAAPYTLPTANLSLWLALVAAVVLVIACANVANLLLARAITRRRELAVRLSLGAGSWRIARQHLTEHLVLALLGGSAGVMLAYWATDLMRQFPLPPSAGRIDSRLLLFALLISVVTGALFGILPAVRAVKVDLVQALKESRAVGAFRRNHTRRALVVLQICLSLALLVGASLFVRSLNKVNAIDSGVDLDRLLVARVDLRFAGYTTATRDEFFDFAISRLEALPQVERAATVHFEPFSGSTYGVGWRVAGREEQQEQGASLNLAGAGYFEAAGTRLLRGRTIQATDRPGGAPVAVVNEQLARLMADDGNVVGLCVPIHRQLRRGGCTEIVGVVETQRHHYLHDETLPTVFLARAQAPNIMEFGVPSLLIRTHGAPAEHVAAVRSVLQALRPNLPYVRVEPLRENLRSQMLPFRLGAALFSMFGALALLLAALGLYGVLGYFVTERTSEIGIRRSLGAPVHAVVALVIRQGMIPAATGLVLGATVAFAGTRYLSSLLFGVDAHDPVSFALAAIFLICVAMLAMVLPAWRAAHVDPLVALRYE